jgi:hypothetical protein
VFDINKFDVSGRIPGTQPHAEIELMEEVASVTRNIEDEPRINADERGSEGRESQEPRGVIRKLLHINIYAHK